jgi:hypothetical protein
MPREGIFVKVLRGGRVADGDVVRVRAWGTGACGVGATVAPPSGAAAPAESPATGTVS